MTSKTEQIINDFTSNVDKNTEYSLKDLLSILTTSYKSINTTKSKKKSTTNGGEVVVKKAPSAYNLFVKDEISRIRSENTSVNPKDLMKLAAENWKAHKASVVA